MHLPVLNNTAYIDYILYVTISLFTEQHAHPGVGILICTGLLVTALKGYTSHNYTE